MVAKLRWSEISTVTIKDHIFTVSQDDGLYTWHGSGMYMWCPELYKITLLFSTTRSYIMQCCILCIDICERICEKESFGAKIGF